MTALTVRDSARIRVSPIKKRGAVISFGFGSEVSFSDRPSYLTELKELFKENGITLSGFGLDKFGGIISTSLSERRFKARILYLKKTLNSTSAHLENLSIGRVQWLEDIWFE